MLVKYIRDYHTNAPVGTVVAVKRKNGIHVGWAWTSKNDQPSKKIGKEIALSRLDTPENTILNLYKMYQNNQLMSRYTLPYCYSVSVPMIIMDEVCHVVKRVAGMQV